MAQRSKYWSCTKFADWVRGTNKPKMGTGEQWDDWHNSASSSHKIRYWIAEEALDAVQNFIWWPVDKIYSAKYYINNRWVTRSHALTASPRDIKPGQWQDVGYRFLPCLFNELQNYVEVELAWWHIAWDEAAKKKYQAPFWARGWFRWRTWRCPEAGIANLEWQQSLTNSYLNEDHEDYNKPSPQAKDAAEILALYKWWTEVYRNRPDPHDASGWSAYCDEKRKLNPGSMSLFNSKNETKEMKARGTKALDLSRKIEQGYGREDEKMMIRLIKIRRKLWT
jgi:hypothetical protein